MSANPTRAATGRATLLVAVSACGFGAIAILVSLAHQRGGSLLNVLTWRYVIAALVLGAIAARKGALRFDAHARRTTTLAGLGQAIVTVTSLSALQFIPAATLAFLFYTYPAWVAIIARVRHSEPLRPARLAALGLSLGGIFLMVGAPGGVALHPLGVTLALFAALFYAAYIPMLDALQRNITPLAAATYMSGGAAVVIGGVAAFQGELTAGLNASVWYLILVLSLVSTVGAFVGFLSGLRVLGPVRTAIISTVEPFFTALMGALLLDQPLTRATLLGGAFIAAAVVLLQLRPAPERHWTPRIVLHMVVGPRRARGVAVSRNWLATISCWEVQ